MPNTNLELPVLKPVDQLINQLGLHRSQLLKLLRGEDSDYLNSAECNVGSDHNEDRCNPGQLWLEEFQEWIELTLNNLEVLESKLSMEQEQ
jgi:hypothetical protein